MIRVIISGSRKFDDRELFEKTLNDILSNYQPDEIEMISGGCKGADKLAEEYAEKHNIRFREFTACWYLYGRAAGPLRNEEMAKYAAERGDAILIAFPIGQSRGTRHMIKLGKQYKFETYVVEGEA